MFLGIGLGTSGVKLLCLSDMTDVVARAEIERAELLACSATLPAATGNESDVCVADVLEANRLSLPEQARSRRSLPRNKKSRRNREIRKFPAVSLRPKEPSVGVPVRCVRNRFSVAAGWCAVMGWVVEV